MTDRPTRYFVEDNSGILYRFAYPGSTDLIDGQPSARLDPIRGEWVWDPYDTAYEHMMRGGYLTEITADQAAGIKTHQDGLDLFVSLGHNRPYLLAEG